MTQPAERRSEPTPESLICEICEEGGFRSIGLTSNIEHNLADCAVAETARLREINTDTAAERDRLKTANAELVRALAAVPLFSESCHGVGGRWLCLHCDRRCQHPYALLHKSDCWVPMVQAVLAKAKESTS